VYNKSNIIKSGDGKEYAFFPIQRELPAGVRQHEEFAEVVPELWVRKISENFFK